MIRILILFILSLTSFAQKSEIVFKSTTSHNYIVGNDYYVEDEIDTTRLLFMGTIKITCPNQDEFIADAQRILKTKAKELNGNAYKLKSFFIQDSSTINLLFDVYFAREKQVDLIKKNALKDKILVFNSVKSSEQRLLVINCNNTFFSENKRVEILCPNKVVILKLDTTSNYEGGITLKFPRNKKAEFFTIKLKDNFTPVVVGSVLGGIVGAAVGSAMIHKRKNITQNEFFSTLNYNTGRILMEIYPIDKQIMLD